jgi:hypothetical protein
MIHPGVIFPQVLHTDAAPKSKRLCLCMAFLEPRLRNAAKRFGWQLLVVSYSRPLRMFEVVGRGSCLGYLGFVSGYGHQTLNVVLHELAAWGLREVGWLGTAAHSFPSEKGQWFRVAQARRCLEGGGVAPWVALNSVPGPNTLPGVSVVSVVSPYEIRREDLDYWGNVLVDMETAWVAGLAAELGVGFSAWLMAFDSLNGGTYDPRVKSALCPESHPQLSKILCEFFCLNT